MIDLHSHTTASDGQHSPAELLEIAARAGIRTLAVTDHDTVAGLAASAEAAAALGLRLVPGIEVSATLNRREVHVLGHFVDPANPALGGFAGRLRRERFDRMRQMVDKVRALGFPVTFEQVQALAGDAHLARPHLARVLVELNYVASPQEAFQRYLGDGCPAYVAKFEFPAEEAIALIRGAGGVATVAHPAVSKVERFELEALARAGLGGLEIDHPDQPPSLREKLRRWAQELDLVPTAGSDYHGPKVAPGRGFGATTMREADFARLEARATSTGPGRS